MLHRPLADKIISQAHCRAVSCHALPLLKSASHSLEFASVHAASSEFSSSSSSSSSSSIIHCVCAFLFVCVFARLSQVYATVVDPIIIIINMLKPLVNSSSAAPSATAVHRGRLSAAASNVTWSSEGIPVQPVPDPRITIRNLPPLAIPPRNPFHAPSVNTLRIKGTVSNTSRGIPPRPEAPAARAEHLSHALAHRVTSAIHAVMNPMPAGNTPSEIAARSLLKEASDLRTIARSIRARAVDINNDDISALYAFISGLEALIRTWFVASETYLTDIFLNDRNRIERWTLRANLLEALLAVDLVRRPALARQGPHTAERVCSVAEKVANEIENCACIDARICTSMDEPQITTFRTVVDRCFKEAGAFVKEGMEQGMVKEVLNPNMSTKALKKSLAKRVFPNKKKWIERHSSWVQTFQRAELEYRQMYAA